VQALTLALDIRTVALQSLKQTLSANLAPPNVRYGRHKLVAPHMSAFGGKADMGPSQPNFFKPLRFGSSACQIEDAEATFDDEAGRAQLIIDLLVEASGTNNISQLFGCNFQVTTVAAV
jgi:hypothetical protein